MSKKNLYSEFVKISYKSIIKRLSVKKWAKELKNDFI